jgi:hypothetical protein
MPLDKNLFFFGLKGNFNSIYQLFANDEQNKILNKINSSKICSVCRVSGTYPNIVYFIHDPICKYLADKINKKLKKYFEIIKEKVIKTEIKDAKKYDSLYKNKITDYIMNKIYEKIYPPEPDDKDFQVFKKSMQLSWVEPKLIIEKQDYYFDNILPDILNQFRSVKKSKTPYKKLNCLENILIYISNLIQFNLGIDKKPGQDDVTPVLNYAFIKAHPFGIYTDIEYIKLFLEDYGSSEFSLTNFESMLEYVLNINHETFNLSEEEFNKKCIEAINNSNKKGID